MAFLLSPLRLGLGLGIGISAATLHPLSPFRTAPLQCQYNAPYSPGSQSAESSWAVNSNVPHSQEKGRSGIAAQVNGFMTPENMKQISLGSVLGLVAGVGLRAFSRVLVVVIGMGVVLVEWAASKGYNILPLHQIQKYVKNVDVRRAVSQHRPFKMSFGATMALAAFAQF